MRLPSNTPPLLFDTALRARRRTLRADPKSAFLHEVALDEVKERLTDVKKSFPTTAILSSLPDFWRSSFLDAELSNEKETLPFAQQGYDLFIHAMSLHAANDPIGQLIQAKQVLRPDGLMLCVALGGETLSELRKATLTAETKLRGGASPRVFPMADLRDYGALLQRAGFTLPVADRLTLSVEHATLFALARDLRAMGETNTLLGRDDGITNRTFWEEVAAQYPKNAETGYLRTTFEFVFLSGWAPHPEQPKPLRPGSVKTGLATAIENARNATSGPQDAIDPEAQTPRSRKETE